MLFLLLIGNVGYVLFLVSFVQHICFWKTSLLTKLPTIYTKEVKLFFYLFVVAVLRGKLVLFLPSYTAT